MKQITRTIVAALAVVPVMALAQGGPPQGGPPPGGPGMMRPGQQAGPAVLFRKDVQTELKLTQDQVSKLREIIPAGPGGPGGFDGPPGQRQGGQEGGQRQGGQRQGGGDLRGGPGGPGGPNAEEMQRIDGEVKRVLNETQYKRYHELELQLAGAFAVLRPDIAEKLKITDEQRHQIMEALRPPGFDGPPRGGQQGGFRGGPPQGGPPDFEQMEKMRKEQEAKVLAILTDAQKKQWTAMLGKKFEFEKMPPPGGSAGVGALGLRGGGF